MGHAISLGLVLLALWFALSGHAETLLVSLGLLSSAGVVLIALRMDVVDHEWRPIPLLLSRVFFYWLWLIGKIVKANMDVVRRILDPALPISPTIVRVKTSQRTDVGKVTFANSITLTPGTVAIDLRNSEIEVHALSQEAAAALQGGDMDRRVCVLEER